MSHPVNDEIKAQIEDEVNNMPCLDLLNFCDEVGIKTASISMEELMDQVYDFKLEQRMQP